MKLLQRLEKNYAFWVLVTLSFVFFLLRLPSLFEPYWYGDEGIYQAIGDSLQDGRILYTGIWDNKPPLLYLVYTVFGSDQFLIRFFSLIIGIITIIFFFFLARDLLRSKKISIILTSLFAFLYGIPLLEGNIANAENFILPFVISGGLLIYQIGKNPEASKQRKMNIISGFPMHYNAFLLSVAGLLVGIAFLFKIVAIFDFAAFAIFLFVMHIYERKKIDIPFSYLHQLKFFAAGFFLPFAVSLLYFLLHGALGDYVRSIFFSNVGYVNHGNKFIIPQGYLLVKTLLLAGGLFFLIKKRGKLKSFELFIIIWFFFSLFNAFFSQRPYTHYMLVLLPSYLLLLGLLFKKPVYRTYYAGIFLTATSIVLLYFIFFPLQKTWQYYGNFIGFVTKQKDVISYRSFFDRRTPRDYDIALYLKSNLNAGDPLFIWGDAAQIYTLSETLPAGKYTVAYHIAGRKEALRETDSAIEMKKPQFIIVLPDAGEPQISLNNYTYKINIREANIYERIE